MDFYNLSEAQAEVYRDHVVLRAESRLVDLANWMFDSGGPIGRMDASVESLEPLWVWFRSFRERGFPGVVLADLPSAVAALCPGAKLDPGMRLDYVFEGMAHYIFETCHRLDSSARWIVFKPSTRGSVDINFHATGIQTSSISFIDPLAILGKLEYRILTGDERSLPSDVLIAALDSFPGWDPRAVSQAPSESILAPRVGIRTVPAPPPRLMPTPITRRVSAEERAGGTILLTMGAGTNDDAISVNPDPLPAEALAPLTTDPLYSQGYPALAGEDHAEELRRLRDSDQFLVHELFDCELAHLATRARSLDPTERKLRGVAEYEVDPDHARIHRFGHA